MNRRVLRTCVFLLLGAIVNVAVAWGIALWATVVPWTTLGPDQSAQAFWHHRPQQAIAPAVSLVMLYPSRWCTYQLLMSDRSGKAKLRTEDDETTVSADFSKPWDSAVIVTSGFPLPTVTGERWDFGATRRPQPGLPVMAWKGSDLNRYSIGFDRPRLFGGSSFRMLGWRPIWPGFAINTVFYAFILWLLFAAAFALRRRLRVKRGLCVKCAYDLRGRAPMSEVCPECGAAAVQSARRA